METLQETENKNPIELKSLTRKNNRAYSVRANRDRFFYPNEWFKFFDALTDKQKITFDILMNTGARINEARHIKVSDIDFLRGNIILRVTKIKAKKKETTPKPRTISLSSQFVGRLKKYCKSQGLLNDKNEIVKDDYIKVMSTPASNIAMKKTLKEIGVKDWYMFSIHNIRKTHGNYLKSLQVTAESEICKRLGHDYNTFLKAYVSADIFTYKDKQDMRLILGDVYVKNK